MLGTGPSPSQIDGLGHLGVEHVYYNGNKLADFADPAGLKKLGIEKILPIVTRGVLLDTAAYRNTDILENMDTAALANDKAYEFLFVLGQPRQRPGRDQPDRDPVKGKIQLCLAGMARGKRIAMPAPVLPLIDAAALWPERGALIGLDLGTKTIGVAASNLDRRLAAGVETIRRKAFRADAARLLAIASERKAVGFVLGLPINMDGSEGPRAQSTRTFARNLAGLTTLPIGLWDERLSTAAVERELIAMDVSRAKRAEVIDEHAAMFILQGALDRLTTLRKSAS